MPPKKRHDKPQRPKSHRGEDNSKRIFESNIPLTWTYEPKPQREYGIDGIVEIFDGDDTTGLTFNVQLKNVEKKSASKAVIKTRTRTYQKSLAVPTLVVVVDGSSTIHFGWIHQFDLYGRKKDAASYTFDLPSVWYENSAAEIEQEVRAARAALDLRSNLPIYWTIDADSSLPANWLASFRVSLERGLAGSKELTRRADEAGWSTLKISLTSDAISIRLRGTPGGIIHLKKVALQASSSNAMAADVMLGLAVELARGGLDVLILALIAKAIPESSMLGREPDLTGFAISRIIEAGRGDMALALFERLYVDQSLPLRERMPMMIGRDRGRLDDQALTLIAERMAEHASTVEGRPAAEDFYNAGNMIRTYNTARGLELYELAAERFPTYRTRGYWWRERGSAFFDSGELEKATESYEEAVRLGDEVAVPLLADAYAYAGAYEKAVKTWEGMRNVTRLIWVVKMWALKALVTQLSITRQDRDPEKAQEMLNESDFVGVDVLAVDALNISALWGAGAQLRESGNSGYAVFYFAAAAFAMFNPMLWFEALLAVQDENEGPENLADLQTWILMSASQECGEAFRQFVLEDEFVPDESREGLLDMIDHAPKSDEDKFVMRSEGKVINF
jgi:tetratricopeptide (TPR) repeat protein